MIRNVLSNLAANIKIAAFRFPLSILFSLFFCIASISENISIKAVYLMILFCGCFWFITVKLFAESQGLRPIIYYTVGITIFSIIALYLYNSAEVIPIFSFLGTGLFFSIFIAPFFNRSILGIQIWTFNYYLWLHICFTILAALILYIGMITIISSLDFLFSIKFYNDIYIHTWLVVATFLSPIVAMAGIPTYFNTDEENYPKVMNVILSYIVLPLLCIYAAILYGYTIKILFTWTLPNGVSATLISAFGCIGMITYLISYPLQEKQRAFFLFHRYFFRILLLPLAILAISIIIRIYEYGLTGARYAVLLLLIWFILSAYFTLAQHHKQSLKLILCSFVILLIVASFSYFGAVSISARIQIYRLTTLLEKNHILTDDQIQTSKKELSNADRIAISSIIEYIVHTKKSDYIQPLLAKVQDKSIHQKLDSLSAKDIMQSLGISYVEPQNRILNSNYNFSFDHSFWGNQKYIKITGYDYLVNINDYSINQLGFTKPVTLGAGNTKLQLSIRLDPISNHYIITMTDNSDDIIFDLGDIIKKLTIEKTDTKETNNLYLLTNKESSKFIIKLIINNVYGRFETESNKPIIFSISTTLLIKHK